MNKLFKTIALTSFISASMVEANTVMLYKQDFENPKGFVNDSKDINIKKKINQLYSDQPAGFKFAQTYTVETLLVTGNKAFGTGYKDPSKKAGNYVVGLQSRDQDDKLGLTFDIGNKDYLNVRADLSSIDLNAYGAPFVPAGAVPIFKFTLFDNPTGARTTGNGTVLSSFEVTATASARDTFEWTQALIGLDAKNSTNGKVTLQIDLLQGGYAAIDNLIIAASNTPQEIPVPAAAWLFGSALLGLAGLKKKR